MNTVSSSSADFAAPSSIAMNTELANAVTCAEVKVSSEPLQNAEQFWNGPWTESHKLAQFNESTRSIAIRFAAAYSRSRTLEGSPWPGFNPNIPQNCKACGNLLLLENLYVDDGCPCNSARGVNFEPKPCDICMFDFCVKPGHRLYELFGLADARPSELQKHLNAAKKVIALAHIAASLCDDIKLDQSLEGIIHDLQADRERLRAEPPREWISVKERLPTWADDYRSKLPGVAEMLPKVRVWDEAWGTSFDAVYSDEDGWDPLCDREPPERITHWQPLPSPPLAEE